MNSEGSAQRRVQLGVAKKIKNGARKIVLDKAEEARVAAFSAFKSLGLDVPEFAQPLLLTAAGNAARKEVTTSSGEETTSSIVLEHEKHISAKSSFKGTEYTDKATSDIEDKLIKPSDAGLAIPTAAYSAGTKNDTKISALVGEGSDTLNYELNTTVDHTDNAETAVSFQLAGTRDENRLHIEYLDHVRPDQYERENRILGNKDNASEKGPVNAVNTLGGFESFLDLWDTSREFFFDIHFNKRSEVNSLAPFEIHGIAICWENSPVHYVNLPKDLFWSENEISNCFAENISGYNKNGLAPKQLLELAKRRWDKICKIMGKKDVKKFGWNLKVQIQVLKNPAFSIQRFGILNLAVKTMGLELIDNSYYTFSPIHVKGGVDICIVAWILWPDEERSSNPNLEKVILPP